MQSELLTRKRSLRSRRVKAGRSVEGQEISNDFALGGGGSGPPTQHHNEKLSPLETPPYRPNSNYDARNGWMTTAHSTSYTNEIGIALGSPCKDPLPKSPTKAEISRISDTQEGPSQVSSLTRKNRGPPKGKRWKSIGGLFGRKNGWDQVSRAPASSQTPTQPGLKSVQNHHYQHRSHSRSSRQRANTSYSRKETQREWLGSKNADVPQSIDNKSLQKNPSLKRNHFSRMLGKDLTVSQSSKSLMRIGAQNKVSTSQKQDVGIIEPLVWQGHGEPLLQVDIPNIEMERYSVMFSGLLQPTQQSTASRQPSPKRKPSLWARRHTHVKGFETRPSLYTNDSPTHSQSSPVLSCKAIHPSRAKLPSFSLFPPSPPSAGRRSPKSPGDRSPLHCAAIVPGGDSLGQTQGDSTDSVDRDRVIVIVHAAPGSKKHVSGSHRGRLRSHRPPRLDLPSQTAFVTAQNPPSLSTHHSPVIGTDKQNLQPLLELEDQLEDPLRQAAEVSIARQISISQRQRQLLTPVVPKIARQPMQPTMVDVQQGSTSRKSHHLVLEDA